MSKIMSGFEEYRQSGPILHLGWVQNQGVFYPDRKKKTKTIAPNLVP